MSLRDEAGDPWGVLAALVVGGLAWAVGVPVALALVIGVVVYVVRVAAGAAAALTGRDTRRRTLAPPPRNSPAGQLLARAVGAVHAISEQAESVSPGPAREQLTAAVQGAGQALEGMRRLAAQATAMDSALQRLDRPRLEAELTRLTQAAGARTSADVRGELTRSIASVREQLAVCDRLTEARAGLLARTQSATLGLEGLVARVVEVVALSETAGGVDTITSKIHDLAGELDGLRQGLAETEALSRKAIAGVSDTAPDVLPQQGEQQPDH